MLRVFLVLAALSGCDRRVAGGAVDGPKIFSEVCARCHGIGGVPERGMVARLGVKPLTSEHVQRELSDSDIRQQILRGSKNQQMPAFEGALTEPQIEAVIAHVRRLGGSRMQ